MLPHEGLVHSAQVHLALALWPAYSHSGAMEEVLVGTAGGDFTAAGQALPHGCLAFQPSCKGSELL